MVYVRVYLGVFLLHLYVVHTADNYMYVQMTIDVHTADNYMCVQMTIDVCLLLLEFI